MSVPNLPPPPDNPPGPGRWRVRTGTVHDRDAVARINLAHAVERGMPADLDTMREGARFVLEDPGGRSGFYVLAVDERDDIVGQLLLTPEWDDWLAGWFWRVSGVYVRPARRREGVCSALLLAAERLAAQPPRAGELRLEVLRSNRPALAAYARAGFRHTRCLVMGKALRPAGPPPDDLDLAGPTPGQERVG